MKDATATCWKEARENKRPPLEFKPEKFFMDLKNIILDKDM